MAIASQSPVFDEVIRFLASQPSVEEILAYKYPPLVDQRLHTLLTLNSERKLSGEEQAELDEFLRMNHLIKMLKLHTQLNQAGEDGLH